MVSPRPLSRFLARRGSALALAAALVLPAGGAAALAGATPVAAYGGCPARSGRTACVDLTHQRMWVQKGRRVVFGPVRVRTGRAGYRTRRGLWRIYWRDRHHYSTIYHVAMPWSQFFSGGQAFHGLAEPMSTPPGSHGCVNMTYPDARALWGVLRLGDRVDVFGRKPGT